MSASYEHIQLGEGESFFIGVFQDNLEKSTWHYHDKLEITFVTEGTGKRIVGDSIEEFSPGDLIFIGSRIPHVWIPEENQYGSRFSRSLESVYLQFGEELFPDQILVHPELLNIKKALKMSKRGLKITGATLNKASELMLELPYLNSFERMMYLYMIMNEIGQSAECKYLTSEKYISHTFSHSNERIARIHEYLMSHYQEEINLDQLATLVHMAPEALCRFFKLKMGITLFEYLNKIKVDYACSLLSNVDLSIKIIGYDSGFNNISHFNKQFKRIMKKTPTEYRKSISRKI